MLSFRGTTQTNRSRPISRRAYADIFGPTTGDRVRRGDAGLLIAVEERDYRVYGEECSFGGGKEPRDSIGQLAGISPADALDLVITNLMRRLGRVP